MLQGWCATLCFFLPNSPTLGVRGAGTLSNRDGVGQTAVVHQPFSSLNAARSETIVKNLLSVRLVLSILGATICGEMTSGDHITPYEYELRLTQTAFMNVPLVISSLSGFRLCLAVCFIQRLERIPRVRP